MSTVFLYNSKRKLLILILTLKDYKFKEDTIRNIMLYTQPFFFAKVIHNLFS
jgi:hypothetical protein